MDKILIVLSLLFVLCASQDVEIPSGSYVNSALGASGDCFGQFPHLRARFSWEQLEFFCQQVREYNEIIFNDTFAPNRTDAQQQFLDSLKFDWNFTTNDTISVRKEIRMMGDRERRLFDWALRNLKTKMIDGVSKYDLIVELHYPMLAPGAHVGAAFLPWHREYLRMFEIALRQQHKQAIGLPYWDSTLDSGLPDPRDSILWHPRFFGNGRGRTVAGPFARKRFDLIEEEEEAQLRRQIGRNGTLLKDSDVEFVLSRSAFKELTACIDLRFEQSSRRVLEWVGGTVNDIYYSPQDFVFFVHHAFLDYLWLKFRQTPSEDEELKNRYPPKHEACTKFHEAATQMKPFEMSNVEAYSAHDLYELYYEYEDTPSCEAGCDSKYLFCHEESGKCMSKIKRNGNCQGLEGYDACYGATCMAGVCIPGFRSIESEEKSKERKNISMESEEEAGKMDKSTEDELLRLLKRAIV